MLIGQYRLMSDVRGVGTILNSPSGPIGEIVFAPFYADHVGVYDPATGDYTTGPAHGEESSAFAGASVAPTGEVVLAPLDSDRVGVYDPRSGSYESGPAHGSGNGAFGEAGLAPCGKVVLAPHNAGNVGVFDCYARTKNARTAAMHPLVNSS